MNIYLNNNSLSIEYNTSLYDVLEANNLSGKKGIAVAVNNKVVRKDDWKSHPLSENDNILVISATKGG